MRINTIIQICILFLMLPFLCNSQDTINNKPLTNHISIHGYLGYRYVAQEIPYSSTIGLGVSYQLKKHFFTFRFVTRVKTLYFTKNFMRVNNSLAPDETIWELGVLYRLYLNEKKSFSVHTGFSFISGFNHGNLIYQPETHDVVYEKVPFSDIGIPIEVRYLLGKKKTGKIFISSVANINSVKSYAGIMLLFQVTFQNHEN
jgi:hypothetical protein